MTNEITDLYTGYTLKKFITRKGLFSRIPISAGNKEVSQEVALGRAVLDKALVDAIDISSEKDWFDTCSEDFKIVCEIADLNPHTVMDRYKIVYSKVKNEFQQ